MIMVPLLDALALLLLLSLTMKKRELPVCVFLPVERKRFLLPCVPRLVSWPVEVVPISPCSSKAGRAYHKYAVKRNNWPKIRGVAKNTVEHPHGGGNDLHFGMPSTTGRERPSGRKCGLIVARRTGCLRGVKKTAQDRD
jgi:hypothetical protein